MVGDVVLEGAMGSDVAVVAGRIQRTSLCTPLCWRWGAWRNALMILSLLAVETFLGAFRDLLFWILAWIVSNLPLWWGIQLPLCTCSSLVGGAWVQWVAGDIP